MSTEIFEQHLIEVVKELRRQLQQIEQLSAFEFTIKAEGRIHDGEVKITFKLDHPYESYTAVNGNAISPVLEEFMRRQGWNERNAPLLISNGD